MEYAQHGNLHDFLKKCLSHGSILPPQTTSLPPHQASQSSSTSSCSSPHYPLMHKHIPLSSQASYSTGHAPLSAQVSNATTHTYLQCTTAYDAAFESYTDQVSNLFPIAHQLSPILHNYINFPTKLSTRDLENFALQIAEGLEHLNSMKVYIHL